MNIITGEIGGKNEVESNRIHNQKVHKVGDIKNEES